jgi:hypothetical protein
VVSGAIGQFEHDIVDLKETQGLGGSQVGLANKASIRIKYFCDRLLCEGLPSIARWSCSNPRLL